MSWVRLDDGFDENEKIDGLSDAAFRLYVRVLCWCSRQETDGKLTRRTAEKRGSKKAIGELVAAELWDETEEGYEVHDYLTYNPSKAQLDEKRARTRDRVTRHRNADGNAVTRASVTPRETPLPARPGPAQPDPKPAGAGFAQPRDGGPAGSGLQTFAERLHEKPRESGQSPSPRHDPLAERITFQRWFPSAGWLSWFRELGLSDAQVDKALTEAKDKLPGRHEIDWWDLKLVSFVEVTAKSRDAGRKSGMTPREQEIRAFLNMPAAPAGGGR